MDTSQDQYLTLITQLAAHDGQLSTRLGNKTTLAKESTSAEEFVKKIGASQVKESGAKESFACGLTRSWVSEIFVGAGNQYLELLEKDPEGVAYRDYTGQELLDIFQKNRGSAEHLIYQLKYLGTHDHDWIVEQFPSNSGYRVYQSYHEAFNLKAWLSDKVEGLFENGDLVIFNMVKESANNLLKKLTQGACSLDDLSNLPAEYSFLLPFLTFVAKYDQTQVENNFRAAWEKFGGGKVIDTESFFENYLKPNASLIDYLRANNLSSNIFSEEYYNLWTSLYGSPNPVYYFNIPFNTIAGQMFPPDTPFQFMVKIQKVGSGNDATKNAEIIRRVL